MRDLGIIYWPSLASLCVSFPSLPAVKVLIFCEIVCWIDDLQDDYIKIPVHPIKEQVKCYTAIQKLLQTDITGVICSWLNLAEFRPSVFGQLWELITSATGAQRGSTARSIEDLDLLYEWLKPRTSSSNIWPVLAHPKLTKNPKFRTFSGWNSSKSWPEFVLLRARLRGILTVLLDMSFVYQSNIYLQMAVTEFFCNLTVPK
jgi:hypothetical protein